MQRGRTLVALCLSFRKLPIFCLVLLPSADERSTRKGVDSPQLLSLFVQLVPPVCYTNSLYDGRISQIKTRIYRLSNYRSTLLKVQRSDEISRHDHVAR